MEYMDAELSLHLAQKDNRGQLVLAVSCKIFLDFQVQSVLQTRLFNFVHLCLCVCALVWEPR